MSQYWVEHWEEVGQDTEHMRINPDVARYNALERLGKLHCVVARSAGRMVGYHVTAVDNSLHYKHILVGDCDAYWLHPDFRVGKWPLRLFLEAERTLRARRAQVLSTATKTFSDKGRLFGMLGYRHMENKWTKWIGG